MVSISQKNQTKVHFKGEVQGEKPALKKLQYITLIVGYRRLYNSHNRILFLNALEVYRAVGGHSKKLVPPISLLSNQIAIYSGLWKLELICSSHFSPNFWRIQILGVQNSGGPLNMALVYFDMVCSFHVYQVVNSAFSYFMVIRRFYNWIYFHVTNATSECSQLSIVSDCNSSQTITFFG